jgi:ArsR family transcriptional regulator
MAEMWKFGPTPFSGSASRARCVWHICTCRFDDVKELGALCRLLGDEARLRLLRVLALDRLNVTELTAVLGLAQSGVSRHLGLLRDAGLVDESRAGGFVFYAAAEPDGDRLRADLWALLRDQFAATDDDPGVRADLARLREVQRVRKESFADHGDKGRQLVPGRSWAAWARALGLLLPPLRVADLGCGDGYLTLEAARWASEAIGIDRSRDVLARARGLAARRKVKNVRWKLGELEDLPLADGDLRKHDEAWVRERLGDRWLGFDDDELESLVAGAGFTDVKVATGARHQGDPFSVLVASGSTLS